jgi:hypothetical protein
MDNTTYPDDLAALRDEVANPPHDPVVADLEAQATDAFLATVAAIVAGDPCAAARHANQSATLQAAVNVLRGEV